jgi:hypothetical protein
MVDEQPATAVAANVGVMKDSPRVRVVLARGRLRAEHIPTMEDIAVTTRRALLERPLAGTSRLHHVAAVRLGLEA